MTMGRPPKKDSEKLPNAVRVRLDNATYEKLKTYAEKHNKSMSEAIRDAIKKQIK